MSDQYYIRIRGEVKGPLAREQIVAQIRRKRLGRHHELSTDAINWLKAGDMPEFFEPVIVPRDQIMPVDPQPVEAEPVQVPPQAKPESTTGDSDGDWYYAKSGNKLGPVSASDIQMWLSSGRLKTSDLVWHESFDNWIPAGDLPQFASAAQSAGSQTNVGGMPPAGFWEVLMGTSAAAKLPEDAVHKYPNLTRYLKIAETSIRVVFVLILFLNFAALIYVVGRAWSEQQWDVVAGGLIAAPLQALLVWLVFISCMAALELVRVVIKIEDNTSR